MNCPKCASETKVYQSRQDEDKNVRYRRRECHSCGHRFKTTESITSYDEEGRITLRVEVD
jgi:transcriptional repressor NrdR